MTENMRLGVKPVKESVYFYKRNHTLPQQLVVTSNINLDYEFQRTIVWQKVTEWIDDNLRKILITRVVSEHIAHNGIPLVKDLRYSLARNMIRSIEFDGKRAYVYIRCFEGEERYLSFFANTYVQFATNEWVLISFNNTSMPWGLN
ncbi:hypothetical protein GW793_03005 [bacterium]|nr:hypothetical protein [bacterium]